ncbi:MAG TPA: hypothetical protein ENI99_02195 [Sedimenticola sp.]|nr:hypothetical protein [Sedimenticola sp.]
MGWASKLSPEAFLVHKYVYRGKISLFVIFITLMAVVMDELEAQEVWFPWLDHVLPIQTQWTKTQDEAFDIWNNITQFQNFGQYENEIREVVILINNMEKQKAIDEEKYLAKYPAFFRLSDEYILVLKSVVTQLQHVLKKLKEKSKNLEAYSWSQYQQDLDHYNQLLSSYRNIGQKMNSEFGRIQSMN